MSDAEQDVAILRLVKERGECKRRKAALEAELQAAGRSLDEISSALKHLGGFGGPDYGVREIVPKIDKTPDICDLSRVKAMLKELSEVDVLLKALNQSAVDLGID